MTTRPALAAAACLLLALAPAPAGAQPALLGDARVASRPAAPATVPRDATAADGAAPRPNATVRVRAAPSYRRYAGRGALIGTGVGVAVGLLAYRNNERKCRDCVGNDAIPFIVAGAGSVLGFAVGNVAWLARSSAGPAAARAGTR